jgi:uncharacterized protein YycO
MYSGLKKLKHMPVIKYRYILIIAAAILLSALLRLSNVLTEQNAHIYPDYPMADITDTLSKGTLSEDDYNLLYHQTGLGKAAVDELRKKYPDYSQRILQIQNNFFKRINYVCEKISPITWEESVVDSSGACYTDGTVLAAIHDGDILLTKSSHTFGWRNGHAALIVDSANGYTLESIVLGTDSCLEDISKWTNYPNFIHLRLKESTDELLNDVAELAREKLCSVPYDLTVGIFSPKYQKAGNITKTYCSHLVWEAFRLFDYDLDSNGGAIVTPRDIANSPKLEVVQIFGVDPDNIWP